QAPTSAAGSSGRARIRASGRPWRAGFPTGRRSPSWPTGSAATRPSGRFTSGGSRPTTAARTHGFAALKTIAAYRGGLELDLVPPVRDVLLAALEANEAAGDPLPVQVHAGFGHSDL